MNKSSRFQFEFFLIALVLVLVYWANLFNPLVPNLDQDDLIGPLLKVKNLNDYFDLVVKHKVYDVQPIRDLSHLFDIWATRVSGIYTALAHNLILFLFGCYFLLRILFLYFSRLTSYLLLSVYLFHPVFTSIIYFETSRKHLLSFCLSMILIYSFHIYDELSRKKRIALIFIYLLASFSQPINFLAPLIFIALRWEKSISKEKVKELFQIMLPYLILMGVVGGINLYYYSVIFVEQSGILKLSANVDDNRLLAIGRMFFQFIFPKNYSTFYNEGSLYNLIGLYLLVIFIAISVKIIKKRTFWVFFILYASVLIILYHKQTNIFYLDTYILTPSLFFLVCFGEFLKKIKVNYQIVVAATISSIFIIISFKEISLKNNFNDYITVKFPQEPTCSAIMGYSQSLYLKKDFDGLREAGEYWIEQECSWINKNTYMLQVFYLSLFVYINEDLTLEEKRNLFEKRTAEGNTVKIFLELIKMKMGEEEAAQNVLEILNEVKSTGEEFCVSVERNYIASEALKNCNFKTDSCDKLKEFLENHQCTMKQQNRRNLYAD